VSADVGALRQENARKVAAIVDRHGAEYRDVNRRLNKLVGIWSVKEATGEQLVSRLDCASHWLREGEPPASVPQLLPVFGAHDDPGLPAFSEDEEGAW
jgi:hypothetical protein